MSVPLLRSIHVKVLRPSGPNYWEIFEWVPHVFCKEYLSRSLFIFQLLGECHCWWTSESPRAHVAKFYGRLRLIRSV